MRRRLPLTNWVETDQFAIASHQVGWACLTPPRSCLTCMKTEGRRAPLSGVSEPKYTAARREDSREPPQVRICLGL